MSWMAMEMDKDKKKRPSDTTPSFPTFKWNKSLEDLKFSAQQEFKGSEEAFHLTNESIHEVLTVIHTGQAPKLDEWDVYVTSFYFKTFNLKRAKERDEDLDATFYSSEEEELLSEDEDEGVLSRAIKGPFDFGFYTEGNKPKYIPYHLYLLVKEAVDIMNVPTWPDINCEDLKNLELVERKIMFFWNYFHCHLPTNWEYSREFAISLVKNCPMPQPGYDMVSYTPFPTIEDFDIHEYEEGTGLSREDMIDIMSIVHSRKTPAYWEMGPPLVLFYCKLCSCFGLDYDHLETASKDEVSLMKVLKSRAQDNFKGSKEAFHLTQTSVEEVLAVFRSGAAPKENKWDAYTKSFYRKTLELCNTYSTEQEEEQAALERKFRASKELASTEQTASKKDMSSTIPLSGEISSDEEDILYCRPMVEGPFDFGFYTKGKEPECIPYHLYLLVKEAADIIKDSEWLKNSYARRKELYIVEDKIWFFCNYLHCHLPTNWEYSSETAVNLVKKYKPMPSPRYNMVFYTPYSTIAGFDYHEFDDSGLARSEMLYVMSVIYSRKTPPYWKLCRFGPLEILFYCKLCCCFGIDYYNLEAASEDDVSLMNVVRID